ncbi:Uncharacterised protein [Mycobacteroides abscessus]|nr:Uncharacterised protein [Mycobacteroides abscessus]
MRVLLTMSGSVNIRSFLPNQPAGNPFHYGIDDLTEAVSLIRSLALDGYYTIANETIDVNDGGVSGVAAGGVIEFAPGDTPRAVEKPGIACLPLEEGIDLLKKVYGFEFDFGDLRSTRLEFSLHPLRRGTRNQHAVVWEASEYVTGQLVSEITWPNRFSRFIGDKAFGLLVADGLGHAVPFTTVIARNVAPFSFGRPTDTGEKWLRTAPDEPVPGKYTTTRGWVDPFNLLESEDDEKRIVSVLSQAGVNALYSGATRPRRDSDLDFVEGVVGVGDSFMLGRDVPVALPKDIVSDVRKVTADLHKQLGPVRIEWAHDGTRVWVLQMHRFHTGVPRRLRLGGPVSGRVEHWLTYSTVSGLEPLRELIVRAERETAGIEVIGDFGLTSHIGELLSDCPVPTRFRD